MQALLDTFGIDWHLLFAQAVNFAILVALLTWLLYKPVLKMVRERERMVAQGVEDAERAAEKLAHADTEVGKRIEQAESEAEGIVGSARASAITERARIVKEAEVRAGATLRDAEARATEQSARALRESESAIARLAMLAAEKVIRTKA